VAEGPRGNVCVGCYIVKVALDGRRADENARPGSAWTILRDDTDDKNMEFKTGDFVVYPTHGVGKVLGTETQEIAGTELALLVINFEHDRMTLRIPVAKAQNSGLRRLSSRKQMDVALTKLKGRARVRRTMWSRRAQEYDAKINSGDPVLIAEVIRDLRRNSSQADQSYSERQMYQAALDRLAREFAAIEKIDEEAATSRLEKIMTVV